MPSPEESNAAMALISKFQAEYEGGAVGLPPGADWVDTAFAYMEHAGIYDDEAQVRDLLAGYGVLVEPDPPAPPPPSFDEALDIPDWWNAFKEFTQSEFSAENPDFVDAVREQSMDPRAIYDTFVSDDAQTQVNLPAGTKTALDAAFAAGDQGYDVFDQAVFDIKKLLRNDTWRRFLKADAAE